MEPQALHTRPFARLAPCRLAIGVVHWPTLVQKDSLLSLRPLDPLQYRHGILGERDPDGAAPFGRLGRYPDVCALKIHATPNELPNVLGPKAGEDRKLRDGLHVRR